MSYADPEMTQSRKALEDKDLTRLLSLSGNTGQEYTMTPTGFEPVSQP